MHGKPVSVRGILLVILMATIFPFRNAFSQAKADTLLPDLAPREVEILGNLEITFPSLRRQPLTGFNPPPKIYEIPRGWRPWTGEYKQESADLPGASLIQPASPPATISVGQHPHKGELSMALGRYLSREVHLQSAFNVGQSVVFYVDGLHDGLVKYKPFGTDVSRQNYLGTAGLTYRAGATKAGVEGSGFYRDYDLYGVGPNQPQFASPERNGQGFGGRAWVATGASSRVPLRLSAAYHENTFETKRADLSQPASVDDGVLSVAGEAKVPGGVRTLDLDGKVWLDSQSENYSRQVGDEVIPPASRDVTTFQAGGDLSFKTGERGSLKFGAEVHGYSVSGDVASLGGQSFGRQKLFVAPRVSYVSGIGGGAEIYVKNTPIVRAHDQHEMLQLNPFLVDGAASLPELSIVNVEGGVVVYKGPLRIAARSGVTTYENFQYFVSAASPLFGDGFFDVRYDDADVLFAGGDLGVTFPGQFSATLTGRWQSAKLTENRDVPNYPGFEGGMRASFVFAGDRGLLQLDGKFIGSRNVDSAGNQVLSGYVDAAFLASYYFKNGIGFFGRIQNMSGDTFERWVGYPVADWVTLGGLRLRW